MYDEIKGLWTNYDGPGNIDWTPYVIGFMTKGKNVTDYGFHPFYFKVMTDFGLNLNTHYLYNDEINAHNLLNLPKKIGNSVDTLKQDWNTLNKETQKQLIEKYNPVRYLKFKPKDHIAWKDKNVDYSYTNGFTN